MRASSTFLKRPSLLVLLMGLAWLSGCATTSTGPAVDHSAARQRILNTAERLIGTRYVLGGESPSGVDCSGLVQYAYAQAGIRVPRTASEQFQAGQSRQNLLPGDLLFFRTDHTSRISHVGIYVGQGQMIHASSSNGQVRKVSLKQRYWQQHMVGGATYLDAASRPVARRWPAVSGRSG
jgi:cell wall-associated NlpC family hydrolase